MNGGQIHISITLVHQYYVYLHGERAFEVVCNHRLGLYYSLYNKK